MAQGNTLSGDLFKLPLEIRHMIYEDVLHHDNFPSDTQSYFSLTKVSRQIRLETYGLATKNMEFFTKRIQKFGCKYQGKEVGSVSSAYLTVPPAFVRYEWPSNTINLQAFALLSDVTLFFDFDDNEPANSWVGDQAPWKRLCMDLTSSSVCRNSPLISILSKRVNFVEMTKPNTSGFLVTVSHRIRNERDVEDLDGSLGISSLFNTYRGVRLRSFHQDAAQEYLAARA